MKRLWYSIGLASNVCALLLLALAHARPTQADGGLDGTLGEQYGSTRALDSDSDGWCQDTSARGDLIDGYAYFHPDGKWYWAFVIDSSQALNTTAASGFITDTANNRADYFIPIDTDTLNTPAIDLRSDGGGPGIEWNREFKITADYYLYCHFVAGTPPLQCDLKDTGGNTVSGATTTVAVSTTIGLRHFVEVRLDDDGVASINSNAALGTMFIAAYDPTDATAPYYSLDAIGDNNAEGMTTDNGLACTGQYVFRDYTDNNYVTAAHCNSTGRPTATSTNDRHCLSYPARTTTTALNDASCSFANAGVFIDGQVGLSDTYTLLTEAVFAGPYVGGDTGQSDFYGESGAHQWYSGALFDTNTTAGSAADIANVFAKADLHFLYVAVTGTLDLFGRAGGGSDRANLFIPIDVPHVTSNSAVSHGDSGESAQAPAGRQVNFKGWDADYAIELIWHDQAQLWRWNGSSWVTSGTLTLTTGFDTSGNFTLANPPLGFERYFGRTPNTYEFALPWASLGYAPWQAGGLCPAGQQCAPRVTETVKLGAYTTGDSNIASGDNWDVYDQAPGLGQGCHSLGCLERIGDEYDDTDVNQGAGTEGDNSRYSGRTAGTTDKSGTQAGGSDVDTLENYFQFTPAANLGLCTPSTLQLRAFHAETHPGVGWLTWALSGWGCGLAGWWLAHRWAQGRAARG